MSFYLLISLLCTIAYGILAAIILHHGKNRIRVIFSIYLVISIIFSIVSVAAVYNIFPNHLLLISAFLPICGISAIISYYHFICAFTHCGSPAFAKLGYGLILLVFFPLAIMGYFPLSAEVTNGELNILHGPIIFLFDAIGMLFSVFSIYILIKKFRSSNDPIERNKISYLLAGIGFFALLGLRESFPPFPKLPLNQLGHFVNAMIISYTILRYQLLDVKLVLKKGLIYGGITAAIASIFLGILFVLHEVLYDWSSPESLAAVIVLAIVMSVSFNWLRGLLERAVNKIIYGKNYNYRDMIMRFAQRMSNVLDLDQLAEAMLKPLSKALSTNQASLLLPDNSKFTSKFAVRLNEEECISPIILRRESPIVNWLTSKKEPLNREIIDSDPKFRALWDSDLQAIVDVEILFPLLSKEELVGILALSKRRHGGLYNSDDIDLITTLTSEAAIVIENAELYTQAKERVNTDDLTGLYNHRYFHQRADEEISRSSRFGEIFCLMSIDLDFFKTYNDVHGHLYGDNVLRKVGHIIQDSLRSIDMAFRYGGDEFSIILPGTSIRGACNVAERIRESIETEFDRENRLITCSIGIASWPTDGVMREELIRSADRALYYAKQTGRNRTYLASEMPISELEEKNSLDNSKGAILNTIYALAATVDAKDHYTYGHSKKVCKYATDIAKALDLPEERITAIHAAGLLHDIGKIGVSDHILGKTGPLNSQEWQPIHSHPTMGVSILKHVESLRDCLAAVQYHHEHFDGSGYPSGLKGTNIPLDARILSVADAYDAMTSSRPYRSQAMSNEAALEEIRKCSGMQFDPDIAEAFIKLMTRPKFIKSVLRKTEREPVKSGTDGQVQDREI